MKLKRAGFKTSSAAASCLIAAALFSGCALIKRDVPLQEFSGSNGNYFPQFVTKYFTGANYFTADYPSIAEARSDIKLIQIRSLNESSAVSQNETNLSWSADGVFLSYEVIAENQRKILVKNLMGDYTQELLVLPQGKQTFLDGIVSRAIHSYNAGLSWSKDSTRFAFMSNGGIGEYNIYVGGVGAREAVVAKSPSKDGYATWNPKNREIAFVSARSGNGDIYLLDLSSQKVKQLSSSGDVDIFPEWFPDGSKVVYCGGDSSNHDIFTIERNQYGRWGQPFRITAWGEDDLRPTVSPNGKLIAFYATAAKTPQSEQKQWNIHVVEASAGKAYNRAELAATIVARNVVVDLNTGPSWSPDSRKIFYVKHDPDLFNPIKAYDLFSGRSYTLDTKTKMNRDLLLSSIGVLSFRAQVGAWDRVFVALTNQGRQIQQSNESLPGKIHYEKL
jgi:Tol biopolymer transport system component